MKILLFAPGNSVHTYKWAQFYKSNSYEVEVVTFSEHFSNEYAKNIKMKSLPKLLPSKLSYPLTLFSLRQILQKFKPDIFHAHYISSYGFVSALANYHPLYISVWGSDIYDFPRKNVFNKKIVQYSLSQADVICSTSIAMAEETKKYTKKQVEITPFGVDTEMFKPLATNKNNELITIGNIKSLKEIYGISRLLESFAIVEREFPNVRLMLVGDGPLRSEYEQLAQRLKIADKTVFVGSQPNSKIPYYINQMDIVALPSFNESFGVAAVEAQACGVPVVANRIGGLPEVVMHEKTGLIVNDNAPQTLATAFKKLIRNPSLRQKLGENGIEFVKKRYEWNLNANYMLQLYYNSINHSCAQK